jgi:uncharacterized membrane protein YphA (DoxX/SURF4 family)
MTKPSFFRQWLDSHHEFFLDLIRIYLGTGLFVKGIYLITHRDFLAQTLEQSGSLWFAPAAIAHYIFPAHILGGILLALGLLTRAAALVQIPILAGAVFYVYLPRAALLEARENLEFSALVLFLLVVFSIYGSGRYSLDYYLSRKLEAKPQSEPAASSA